MEQAVLRLLGHARPAAVQGLRQLSVAAGLSLDNLAAAAAAVRNCSTAAAVLQSADGNGAAAGATSSSGSDGPTPADGASTSTSSSSGGGACSSSSQQLQQELRSIMQPWRTTGRRGGGRPQNPQQQQQQQQQQRPQPSQLTLQLREAASKGALSRLVLEAKMPLTVQELQAALHSAARLGQPPSATKDDARWQKMLAALGTRFQEVQGGLFAPQLLSMLISLMKLGRDVADKEQLQALLETRFCGRLSHLPPDSVGTFGTLLARMDLANPRLLEELLQAAGQQAHTMSAHGIKNLLWALSKLHQYDWTLLLELGTAVRGQLGTLSATSLSSLLQSLSALQHYDDHLLEAAESAAVAALPQMNGNCVASIAAAFGKLKYDAPTYFKAITAQMPELAPTLRPSDVSTLLWACAKRGHVDPATFQVLGERAIQLQNELLPHQCSLIAWSFAKARQPHQQLFEVLSSVTIPLVPSMAPHNIANMAWSLGQLGVAQPQLLSALAAAVQAEAASNHLVNWGSQNLTDTLWGFSCAGYQDPQLYMCLAAACLHQLAALSPHSITDAAWALGNALQQQPAAAADTGVQQLLQGLCDVAVVKMERMNPAMLADLLWACAILGQRNEGLLTATAAALPAMVAKLQGDLPSQAKLLWSLQQLQFRDPGMEAALQQVVPHDVQALLSAGAAT